MKKKPYPRNQPFQHQPARIPSGDTKIIKRLLLALLGIAGILLAIYFLTSPIVSNLDVLWKFLSRGDETINPQTKRIPPSPPYLNPITQATKEKTLIVAGFSEPGAKIELFLNGSVAGETIADKDGYFNFSDLELIEGENRIYSQATDTNNNVSKPSGEQIVIFDQKPPELTVENPANGYKATTEAEQRVEVRGKTEPDIQVTVNDHWAMVDRDGNFSYRYPLEEGVNQLVILAKDKAGNETKVELTATYEPPKKN